MTGRVLSRGVLALVALALAACSSERQSSPAPAPEAPTPASTGVVPATAHPLPTATLPPATSTPVPTGALAVTAVPRGTAAPTITATAVATAAATPAAAAQRCEEATRAFAGTPVRVTCTATELVLESNGLPSHETGAFPNPANPNRVAPQRYRFVLPLEPELAASPSALNFGPIGITVSGAAFFNPYNALGQDAVLREVFDACNGHPAPTGQYHYHQDPVCAYRDTPGEHSPLIGFALDGFALYGPQGEGGGPPADLDRCNGHLAADGRYHYHVTRRFPYLLGCYRGELPTRGR